MKKNKYIKEIAERLPVIHEQTVSGYYEDYNEEGEIALFPNVVNHPINHERRLNKIYKSLGMEGVKKYLDDVHEIQKRNYDLYKAQLGKDKEETVDNENVNAED